VSAIALLVAAVAFAPPPPAPGRSVLWDRELFGAVHIEVVRELTWPGPYMPAFVLSHGQRIVHRLSLGFLRGPLRLVSFDAVAIGPQMDPRVAMTSGGPTREGLPVLALRGNVAMPGTQWNVSATQTFAGYASSAPTPLVGRTPRAIGLPTAMVWRRF
jgi:hypothetical protein